MRRSNALFLGLCLLAISGVAGVKARAGEAAGGGAVGVGGQGGAEAVDNRLLFPAGPHKLWLVLALCVCARARVCKRA